MRSRLQKVRTRVTRGVAFQTIGCPPRMPSRCSRRSIDGLKENQTKFQVGKKRRAFARDECIVRRWSVSSNSSTRTRSAAE